MILYSYFRSSAAYRVRIALNIKNIEYEIKPVHLLNSGGEQHSEDYHQVNPSELVPTLNHNSMNISQSMAIMDYLEHVQARPSLYPLDIQERVACQEFALSIACDIHPINNLRVLQKLKKDHNFSEEQVKQWNLHWIGIGFDALEEKLGRGNSLRSDDKNETEETKKFCFGEHPSLADICLIPQVYNGLRHGLNMDKYPILNDIYQHCKTLKHFKNASPECQPDFPRP